MKTTTKPTIREQVTEAAATPSIVTIDELTLESATVGQPVKLGDIEGRVQSRRSTFALVTTHLDSTESSGARGMKGNLGNRSKADAPRIGCNCKVPQPGFLYAFVGTIPADFAGAPSRGTICSACDRAVVSQPADAS